MVRYLGFWQLQPCPSTTVKPQSAAQTVASFWEKMFAGAPSRDQGTRPVKVVIGDNHQVLHKFERSLDCHLAVYFHRIDY